MSIVQRGVQFKIGIGSVELDGYALRSWSGPTIEYTRQDVTGTLGEVLTKIGKDKRRKITGTIIAKAAKGQTINQHEFCYVMAPLNNVYYVERASPTYSEDILTLELELVRLDAWEFSQNYGPPLFSGPDTQLKVMQQTQQNVLSTVVDEDGGIATTVSSARCNRAKIYWPNNTTTDVAEGNITNLLENDTLHDIQISNVTPPQLNVGDVVRITYFLNGNFCPLIKRATIIQ